MSINVGGIHVKGTPDLSAKEVARIIADFYTSQGAYINKDDALSLEPLSLEEDDDGRLGYLITPFTNGWIGIYDSERYTTNFRLAAYLAEELKLPVIAYELSGAADDGVFEVFRPDRNLARIVREMEEEELDLSDEDWENIDHYSRTLEFLEGQKISHLFIYYQDISEEDIQRENLVVFSLGGVTLDMYEGPHSEEEDEEEDVEEDVEKKE